MEIQEIDIYELLSDKTSKVIQRIIEETEKELRAGKPYYIIRKRQIQKMLSGSRGLQFVIKQLKKKYRVVEDGSWYIISPKK
mgnify:CR=1 FL=1